MQNPILSGFMSIICITAHLQSLLGDKNFVLPLFCFFLLLKMYASNKQFTIAWQRYLTKCIMFVIVLWSQETLLSMLFAKYSRWIELYCETPPLTLCSANGNFNAAGSLQLDLLCAFCVLRLCRQLSGFAEVCQGYQCIFISLESYWTVLISRWILQVRRGYCFSTEIADSWRGGAQKTTAHPSDW